MDTKTAHWRAQEQLCPSAIAYWTAILAKVKFSRNEVIGSETGTHHFVAERKCQTMEWIHLELPMNKKVSLF